MSAILSIALTAFLSVLGRLATAAFFEAVLVRVVIWCGRKLAEMTTNNLDNEIMDKVETALQKDDAP